MKYLHNYKLNSQFREEYINDEKYKEPWVGFVKEDESSSYNKDYLTFEILSDGDIVWKSYSLIRTIKYSVNGGEWISITSSLEGASFPVTAGDIVRFEGNNSTYTEGGNSNTFSATTASFKLSGNIESLTGFEEMGDRAFQSLFEGCVGLTDASELKLPSTVTIRCYWNMFAGCTALVKAPVLPATTLAEGCYSYMFYGCTSLTKAPTLPATTLARSCYTSMFQGCRNLVSAPALPVANLIEYCYDGMFFGCSSLTAAPALPATTLVEGCYKCMFYNCTSLVKAPAFTASTVAKLCCSGMFAGCTSLKDVTDIDLAATTLADYCYGRVNWSGGNTQVGMFAHCTSLTTSPKMAAATTLGTGSYIGMFEGCSELIDISSITLPATTLTNSCYYYMFADCKKMTTAPELPATELTQSCYERMFWRCENLNYIKCLATDISATNCLTYWADNVAPTGTFVKNRDMNDWTIGSGGIPDGWTVEDA